jgi:hypothetical protein
MTTTAKPSRRNPKETSRKPTKAKRNAVLVHEGERAPQGGERRHRVDERSQARPHIHADEQRQVDVEEHPPRRSAGDAELCPQLR